MQEWNTESNSWQKNRGVTYYNDSKGTNPDAAIRGIKAMNRKTVLIGGGYDKDSSYDEWIQAFDGKVKKLVLIGADPGEDRRVCKGKWVRGLCVCRYL